MELVEEHYCVRWKGFHSNIVSALEDLKTDEAFVDVTLSCDGETIQGHKVILSACSPYFKKILKDNPCRHPVLILNDIELDVLDALMTYMYHGTVSVPQNKLQMFLKTAEALKIKGIVDTNSSQESATPSECSSILSSPHQVPVGAPQGPVLPVQVQELLTIPQPLPLLPPVQQHPAGDLTLLASAAAEPSAQLDSTVPNAKRRKTAPRKLGTYLLNSSHLNRGPYSPSQNIAEDDGVGGETEKENNSLISHMMNKDNNMISSHMSQRDKDSIQNHFLRHDGLLKEGFTNGSITTSSLNQCKVSAINLTTNKCSNISTSPFNQHNHHPVIMKQENIISIKEEESLDLTVKTLMHGSMMSPDQCESPSPPHSASHHFQMLTTSMLPTSSATPLNLLSAEGATAADQMAALLGPDQMAALLGPSWKSRQPRMCQYCQRMFSNKFNLKQHILNMHTVGRELQCEICQKKVKNKWYLRRHHVTHHGAPLKK
eukprot:GFUD01120223.1.p1 GENE.GFUD01120223.1~~GFUD01120223.1.p1  ORF type:complete len:487 (+),score=111.09 GFUD01120223.1:215-1675(+)